MKKAEAIPKHWWRAAPGAKRWMKRMVRRARRREERRDPEAAPGPTLAYIRGWYW